MYSGGAGLLRVGRPKGGQDIFGGGGTFCVALGMLVSVCITQVGTKGRPSLKRESQSPLVPLGATTAG